MTNLSSERQKKAGILSWFEPKSFRTKFIMVVGAAVVFDLFLSGSIAVWNVMRLGRDASTEIQQGLENASNEYLENYIETTALRANLLLGQVNSEVSALASAMQSLIDNPEAQSHVGAAVSDVSYYTPELVYDAKGNWAQNGKDNVSVLSVWGYLLGPDKKPLPEVQREIENSAIFDLVSAGLMSSGSKKLQMYYVGPKERPIMRTTPYSDQAQTFDKLYPGHNNQNFWDFFFPGVYETWQAWIKNPSNRPKDGYVTSTMPYIDAITGNLIVTFFHPLWNKERTDCAGSVAVDITLEQLSDLIIDVHVAKTGFGFLTKSNGNVLAIPEAGQKTLGIEIANDSGGTGVTGLDRSLGKSVHPEIAKLRLPTNDAVSKQTVTLHTDGTSERHIVVLRRLKEINVWGDGKVGKDYPMLGFVVPEREIYETLYAAQGKVSQATSRIRDWQMGILMVSLGVVLCAVFGISRRITAGITSLAEAAKRIENKDYSVRVDVPTKDEVGELAHAFNAMTTEIESYTTQLEQKVAERTEKLALANREIQALNEKLKVENVRMGAELDVARRIQMMVLPKPEELRAVPRLDIAAHMEPASEVGGDYYDVLQAGSRVKIGIGDVTGHGLESGVLMLMVQSVARALLESGERDPKRFLSILNNVIFKNVNRTESGNNLTLSFIDYSDENVVLTGQHEEVILIRRNGDIERIETLDLGFPVGLEEEISDFVDSRSIRFENGDLMILYTDGITEAENPDGELFNVERLCESALRWRDGTAAEVKQGIVRDVMTHLDTQKIHDDITLVVIKHL